jgi:hypothetical protein
MNDRRMYFARDWESFRVQGQWIKPNTPGGSHWYQESPSCGEV